MALATILATAGMRGGGLVSEAAAGSWKVSKTSRLTLLGAVREVKAQTLGTGAGTPPKNWQTAANLLLPKVPLAFGQSIEFLQNGTAQGVIDSVTGRVTLDLPLLLRDPTGASQSFTAYLTTGTTNGVNSDGGPVCDGSSNDPTVCRGAPLDTSGNFEMVAIVNIPQQGNTLGSGSTLFLELSGSMVLSCDGTVCVASDSCHLAGACDPATGMCSNPAKPNGSTCSDGNGCTRTDTCQAGVCVGSSPVTCTAIDSCHTTGSCDTSTGICSTPAKSNGTACNDGNACTRSDTCQAGVCTGANPVVCGAANSCFEVGTCNTGTGVCSSVPKPNGATCNDGNACTQSDTCQSGACLGTNPVVCTELDQCHRVGTCNTTTGVCSNPTKSNGSTCNDSNGCTRTDTCQGGACVGGSPLVCTSSDPCHNVGTCNPATGTCSSPAKPDGTACSDSNACTRNDSCQAGVCTGAITVCTASDQCHNAGTCNTSTGACSNPSKPNGTACADASVCSQNDTCQGGSCTAGPQIVCTPSDSCHNAGTCNPTTGCSNPAKANGSSCSDSNACTRSDSCQAGTCVGTNPVVCGAGDACHDAGLCDPATGSCSSAAKPNGTPCTDGDSCTQSDTCTGGSCTGVPVSPPEELAPGVRLVKDAGTIRIEWQPAPGATAFDVTRGLLSGLPVGTGEGEECLGSGLSDTSITDDDAPPPSDGFWYLVRGNSSCAEGPYGFERVNGATAIRRETGICRTRCSTVDDCPGADTECRTNACTAGMCAFLYAPAGVTTNDQLPMDCRRTVCDGSGRTTSVADDTDLPVDGDPCTRDLCTNGTASHPPAAAGTACSQNGGAVCNGTGACVQCVVASDCPGTDTDCRTRTCGATTPGTCGFAFTAAGTTTSAERTGDCRRSVCDGAGGMASLVDDTDLPVDSNPCTGDVCSNGTPSNPPLAAGVACTTGTTAGVCNGSGLCGVCGGTMQRCCTSYPFCRPGLSCQSGLCR